MREGKTMGRLQSFSNVHNTGVVLDNVISPQ